MKEVSDLKIDIKLESINEKGKLVEAAKNIVGFVLQTSVRAAVQFVAENKFKWKFYAKKTQFAWEKK